MNYTDLPELINTMHDITHKNVSAYMLDVVSDISTIIRTMNEGTLPKEAYWLTRENGTQFGFADERIARSDAYGYVINNENSILSARENEHCYKINFDDVSIEEIEPKEFIKEVKELGKPPKEILSEKAMNSSVYVKGYEYARENSEIEQFRESRSLNQSCSKIIKEKIESNSSSAPYGQYVDTAKALSDVLECNLKETEFDRVKFVTAATIFEASSDGRYDRDVKEWAAEQFNELPSTVLEKENIYTNVHPTIFNTFARNVMAQEKSLVQEASKAEKKKQDVER